METELEKRFVKVEGEINDLMSFANHLDKRLANLETLAYKIQRSITLVPDSIDDITVIPLGNPAPGKK